MTAICLYFQVHQPFRLRKYTVFDVGKNENYFDEEKNRRIIEGLGRNCYLPTNALLLELINNYGERFKVAFSITGTVLEQLEEYEPEVIQSFKALAKTGGVEFIGETYYHSLASLFSRVEFREQILLHRKKIEELFGQRPEIFKNSGLVYRDWIGKFAEELGFNGILIEGWEKILGWRSPNYIYSAWGTKKLKLLLRNYKLSDDVSLRFSNCHWKEYPLTAEKYASWIAGINSPEAVVNIFMNYETFGGGKPESTGVFEFLRALPEKLLGYSNIKFMTPGEIVKSLRPVGELQVGEYISAEGSERDLSCWLGNRMQLYASKELYNLERAIKESRGVELIDRWRRLTTSNHFYFMGIKNYSLGEAEKYIDSTDSPYEGFIIFMNIIKDLKRKVSEMKKEPKRKRVKLLNPGIYKEAPIYHQCFFLYDGQVLKSICELLEALKVMDDSVFSHHVTQDRNDFANWIRDIFGEKGLAEKVAKARSKRGLIRTISSYFAV